MLRIDINSFKLSSENCPNRTLFADGECEAVVLQRLVGFIKPSHHLVQLRLKDLSVQGRADYLLDGATNDISMSLRTHPHPIGWFVRLPANPSRFETFLAECLNRHIGRMVATTHPQLDIPGRGVLLPPREHIRPARVEINFCSSVTEAGCRNAVYLHSFARGMNIALSEYDANYAHLYELHMHDENEKDNAARTEVSAALVEEKVKRRRRVNA